MNSPFPAPASGDLLPTVAAQQRDAMGKFLPRDGLGFIERNSVPEPNSGCWLWLGYDDGMYPQVRFHRSRTQAHRLSWQLEKGPIPKGLCVCHSCDNLSCVNPDHLFLGTHRDNCDDRDRKHRQAYGEKNGMARLTEADAISIREDSRSLKTLAEIYDVHPTTIHYVKSGKTWRLSRK